jgi:hypothetical protein
MTANAEMFSLLHKSSPVPHPILASMKNPAEFLHSGNHRNEKVSIIKYFELSNSTYTDPSFYMQLLLLFLYLDCTTDQRIIPFG